jgi:hypothetical protein
MRVALSYHHRRESKNLSFNLNCLVKKKKNIINLEPWANLKEIKSVPSSRLCYNNNSRFDTRCISPVMRIQNAVTCFKMKISCLSGPENHICGHSWTTRWHVIESQHRNNTKQLGSLRPQRQHKEHRNTRHNGISLLWPEKEIMHLFEFSGLYRFHLKEGRKPKYSDKTPDDLFICWRKDGLPE